MERQQGFTLLEMLITVALIAILLCIAYPSYRSHLQRAQRDQARIGLHTLAARLENYYGINGQYPSSLTQLGKIQDILATNRNYTFTLTSNTINYRLQAQSSCSRIRLDSKNRLTETTC